MSQMHHDKAPEDGETSEVLEQLLRDGVSLHNTTPSTSHIVKTTLPIEEDEEEEEVYPETDVQGSLGLFAEASQDMATANVELSMGRHFACADYCNQVAEKAAQAVSLRRFGRRSRYDHDLRALGTLVGAPEAILIEMEKLTPYHPEAFYIDTPPEEADAIINAEQASSLIKSARTVLRWARSIVLQL